jgi:hypothetical protein
MPLIEVNQNRQISASVRFEESVALQINQYAAFIKASPDEVVNKGLAYLFSKDRDFIEFQKSPESRQVPSVLRVRKVPVVEQPDAPSKNAVTPVAAVATTQAKSA